MEKRKHRVVVDLSFDGPVTERYAVNALRLVLDDADKERSLQHWSNEIIKSEPKAASRVARLG
ncbi:MAG: hypothetical protein E5W06_00455 [Mesorhizobium sp.]|nr:MAG: hypothetical protein E5W06_00455 [Mesorhizobium sp.]